MPTCLVHNCEAAWRFCLSDLAFTFVSWSNLLIPITGVVQDWFKVVLQQEDLGYAQPWLFTWHLFVEELRVHFGVLDPVGNAANLIDNLHMKPGDKIVTYNVEFMWYVA